MGNVQWINHTCETANIMTSLCYSVVIINRAMTMHFDFVIFIFNPIRSGGGGL